MFEVNNRITRIRCKICSKLTVKTPERCQWRRSAVFIANFEHISYLFLVFLLLTLHNLMLAEMETLHCDYFLVQSQQWKHHNNVWNLLKVYNKDTRGVVLESLLLTLNRFHILLWWCHCWLWTSKHRLGDLLWAKVFQIIVDTSKVIGNFLKLHGIHLLGAIH